MQIELWNAQVRRLAIKERTPSSIGGVGALVGPFKVQPVAGYQ